MSSRAGLESSLGGYYSNPTIHGQRVVFVSEGDLWAIDDIGLSPSLGGADSDLRGGGGEKEGKSKDQGAATSSVRSVRASRPYRIEHSGRAQAPLFSPDGQWIAYNRWSVEASEVFVMPARGGCSTRLTYLGALSQVCGWCPSSVMVRHLASPGVISPASRAASALALSLCPPPPTSAHRRSP